jgi:ribonuclease P protein component
MLRGEDFRKVMRGGKKTTSKALVSYRLIEASEPKRFGFVVSKACGGAVKRNQLKRRLRAMARQKMESFPAGSQFVIRCLPGSAELDFSELATDFDRALGL